MTAQFDFSSLDGPFEADWPVDVSVPQDGGAVKTERFMARFRLISADELKAMIAADDFEMDMLPKRYFVGFGLGETQIFSEALRESMIQRPYIKAALEKAYQAFAMGIAAKN